MNPIRHQYAYLDDEVNILDLVGYFAHFIVDLVRVCVLPYDQTSVHLYLNKMSSTTLRSILHADIIIAVTYVKAKTMRDGRQHIDYAWENTCKDGSM